jgi:RimJ/RimL family protein N-acetyltransferase
MSERTNSRKVRIETWADTDLLLLHRLNVPEMMEHLGGPESEEKLLARHMQYLGNGGTGGMFSIILLPECEAVGFVGYWERVWQGETVFEMGWSVLPPFQGMGIATAAAAAAAAKASAEQKYRYIHAFPSINNPASNAICRKLDFLFIAESELEYPRGSFMQCNDWCLDLTTRP